MLALECEAEAPRWLRCELHALPRRPGGALARLSEPTPVNCEPTRSTPRESPSLESADILHDLSAFAALATSLSPNNLLERPEQTLDLLREATGAESAELFLADPIGHDMLLTAYRGPFRRAFSQFVRFAPGKGFPGLVMAHRQQILTTTLADETRYLRDQVKEKGFRSYLCVPLFAAQSVLGAISVSTRRDDVHLERALQLLTWASVPISTGLQIGLLQAGRIAAPEKLYLGDDDRDLDQFLREVLRRILHLAHADDGTLVLLNQLTGGVTRRICDDPLEERTCPCLDHPGASAVCPALSGDHGTVLFGARHAWPPPCQRLRRPGNTTYCLPMRVDGEGIGMIQLVYRDAALFPPTRHLGMLLGVADQAAAIVRLAWGRGEQRRNAETISWQWLQTQIEPATPESPRTVSDAKSPGSVIGRITTRDPLLRIRCFGRFELYREGVLLTPQVFKRRKALTLLKILLLHAGRPVAKDTLVECLWPEVDPQVGANRLHVVVHALRECIEPTGATRRWVVIQNNDSNYIFDPMALCWMDVTEFRTAIDIGERAEAEGESDAARRAYDAAVRLYRGDLLEDDHFADWCWLEREYLREVYLGALQRLAEICAYAGDFDRAISNYRQILRKDLLRETVLRRLVECLWRAGRRDEALHHYELFSHHLRRELDVAPLIETEELIQRVRSTQPQ